MAWNGSDVKGGAKPRTAASHSGGPTARGRVVAAAAVTLVAVLSVALYFAFSPRPSGVEDSEDAKTRKIAEVKPSARPAAPAEKAQAVVASSNAAPKKMWYDADTNSAAYKVYHHKGPVITNSFALKTQSLSARTFKYTSDKIIGQLLSVKPGASLFGDVKYDERFTRRFLESLKEPIVIDPEDSDQVKALKEAVIESRKELKAAYDRGEDIAQIMTDTRKELKELGAYRAELQKQVNDIIRKDIKKFSAQDMEDCISAANKMLSDRGCQPLRMPGLMRHRLKVLQSQGIQETDE